MSEDGCFDFVRQRITKNARLNLTDSTDIIIKSQNIRFKPDFRINRGTKRINNLTCRNLRQGALKRLPPRSVTGLCRPRLSRVSRRSKRHPA